MWTRTYPSVRIQAYRTRWQPEWMWSAVVATISAIVGVTASFQIVPAAAAAIAPQVGLVGAHLILAAIYGLAALVVLTVLRLAAAR
jgi:hypothetical protein